MARPSSPLPRVPLRREPRALRGAELRARRLARLGDLPDPPAVLHVAGAIPGRTVAIVGTRRSDGEAEAFARSLAQDLGRQGLATISGGASGIDAAAHRGSLAAGAPTVAVLATHPSRAYPRRHVQLFGDIVRAGGALVGEREDERALPGYFLSRNRLIAALAEVVVVVQAPLRSGALSTARVALALGRPVYTVPAAPWDPRSAGNLWLLDQGARPCVGIRSLGEALGLTATGAPVAGDSEPAVSAPALGVWRQLGAQPRHPDAIALAAGIDVASAHRALMELVVAGAARPVEGARFVRASAPR